MIILNNASDTLQAFMGEAIATVNPDFIVSWADKASILLPNRDIGALNGTADVTMVVGSATDVRMLRALTICNIDTIIHTITVQFNDTTNDRVIVDALSLNPGETLYWSPEAGWKIQPGDGNSKQPLSPRLTDIADNLTSASGLVEKTSADTFGTVAITTAGKALIDDASAAAQLTTLGTAGLGNVYNNLGIKIFGANIADDAFASVNVGNIFNSFIVLVGNVDSAGIGGIRLRTAAPASMTIVYQLGTTINAVAGDGTLNGTTGPDGKLNVRSDSASGNLYIENRTGSTRGYIVHLLV